MAGQRAERARDGSRRSGRCRRRPVAPFYGTETLGGVDYFTAVYSDVAVAEACVNCHNAHVDSPRDDFAVGDTMGGVVIRIPMR